MDADDRGFNSMLNLRLSALIRGFFHLHLPCSHLIFALTWPIRIILHVRFRKRCVGVTHFLLSGGAPLLLAGAMRRLRQ